MTSFNSKVVLITGAANGIGRELALQLDNQKCHKMILIDVDKVRLGDLIGQLKTPVSSIILDLSSNISTNKSLIDEVNNCHPDVVIANAGVGGLNPGDNFSEEINQKMMQINYFGTTGLISLVLPKMIQKGQGHIIGVASLAGLRGMPQAASYCASKAAQITFLESLRLDVKSYGIKVTTVLPGFIKTKMTNHNDFKMPFMLSVSKTASKIIDVIKKEKSVFYFPFPINLLSIINKFLPVFIYDWLILFLNPSEKKQPKIF